MNKIFDVIIVGAGTAGLAALREVKKSTSNFILINDGPWGTICARVGCMPSKLLIEVANAFHHRGTFDEFGIRGASGLTLDIAAALRRVRRLRDDFVASALKTTDTLGERAISGRARLLGVGRLEVNGQELRARNIIIATGSRPVVPAPWRTLDKQLLTTDTLFEQESLPSRMAVVGLGAIGVEMAQALSRLSVNVTAFGESTHVAGLSDPKVNAVARELLEREFPLYLGEKVDLEAVSGGVRAGTGTAEVVVDRVLVALGRRPNIDGLGLETLGIALDGQGLPPVNPHTMQIADLPVFMAGDANQQIPLLHEAADGGHIAGINSTRPAPVNKGIMRLYAEPESGRLLGTEMCAPAGEHMAHLLALAIDRSLTVQDMLRLPFYHPVLEEGLRTALRDLAAQLPPCGESDLAACDAFNADALD